jgi:hypothetical protein
MRSRKNEEGIALVAALLLGVVAISLTIALLTYASGAQPLARNTQDWNAAYSAAEAGVDDFLYRLTRDPEYWQNTGTPTPSDGNLAFTQFVSVPGSPNAGQFKYKVTQQPNPSTGANIALEVTGKVRKFTRKLRATIRRRGFIDYLYFTEYEGMDPDLASNPNQYATDCSMHWYDTPAPLSSCTKIVFGSNDVINGPLHSNDQIWLNGTPTFNGDVSTSWNHAAPRYGVSGSASPTFARPGDPKYATPLGMPESNGAIRDLADKFVSGQGCLYTGPTKITLNANGTMDVVSPQTDPADINAGCGTGSAAAGVNSTGLSLPTNGVVYIQNKVAATTSPYYTTNCSMTGLPVPFANDIANSSSNLNYTCSKGDALISGVLKGRLTIAAENRIVVMDDVTYSSPPTNPATTDFLGLIANNFVETFHPVQSCSSGTGCFQGGKNLGLPWNGNLPLTNLTINAAILALNHSFRVQSYLQGDSLGTLTIVGAIAQQYRGIVRYTGTPSGYAKNYNYDNRLKVQSPPHFLDPVQSAWLASSVAELKN